MAMISANNPDSTYAKNRGSLEVVLEFYLPLGAMHKLDKPTENFPI